MRGSVESRYHADDTRVHGSCQPVEIDSFTSKLSECIGGISNSMHSNRLQLNTDKTEVIWCTTGRRQHKLPTNALSIGGMLVTSVRNLGISLMLIWWCGPTFNEQYRDALLCSVNCERPATPCRPLHFRHLWSLWWYPDWIIETACWLIFRLTGYWFLK